MEYLMPKPINILMFELLDEGPQTKSGDCAFCMIPLKTAKKKPIPHAAFCPWYPEHVDRYMIVVQCLIDWKRAKINLRNVLDETHLLDGIEYEADPSSPEMILRIDARAWAYRAERRLIEVIGVTEGTE